MLARRLLLVACTASFVCAQETPAPSPQTPHEMSPYAAQREAVIAPGLEAMRQKDYAAALENFRSTLLQYPNDGRVLMLAGNAAKATKNFDEAIEDYLKALHQPNSNPWPVRFSLIAAYAAAGHWDEFDAERQKVRTAKQGGDPFLAKVQGYVIDEFDIGDQHVTAAEFPALLGRFHTRYRFFLRPADQADNTAAPAWAPHIDVESDDIDQLEFAKLHPDKAAAGERSFSLDTYPAPGKQGLIKFYLDGEPTYRAVRADVISSVSQKLQPLSSTTVQHL